MPDARGTERCLKRHPQLSVSSLTPAFSSSKFFASCNNRPYPPSLGLKQDGGHAATGNRGRNRFNASDAV